MIMVRLPTCQLSRDSTATCLFSRSRRGQCKEGYYSEVSLPHFELTEEVRVYKSAVAMMQEPELCIPL